MAEKFKLFEADIDVDGVIKKSVELKQEINNLKLEQQKLKATTGETSEEFVKNEASLKKVSAEYRINQKQVANLTETNGKLLTVEQRLTMALNQEVKSINSATKNNKDLKEIRNSVNVETVEGQKAIEEINKKLNQNTDIIKGNTSALEQQKINIGNYPEALDGVTGGLGGMVKGFASATKASLAFLTTPIGVVLAVVAGVLALVKAGLDRSEESTNKIKKAFSGFQGIANGLFKVLEPLSDFLIDGIVKGFELAEKAIYQGIETIASGLQLLGWDKKAAALRNFNAEVQQGSKDAKALADSEAKLKDAQRETAIAVKILQKEQEDLRQIRDDETLSFAERIKANDDLALKLKEQQKLELETAEIALESARLNVLASGETTEAKDRLAEALINIADIQERVNGIESEQLTNRVALQREAADQAKQIADEAIAQQRAELAHFIAYTGNKAKSLEQQLANAEIVYRRETEILEAELANRNLTQTEYDTALLELKNDLSLKYAEATIDNAQYELDAYIANHQSKIDADLFYSEETLKIEKERLNGIKDARLEFEAERLAQGLINEQDYNAAINAIDEENRLANEEAENLREEAKKEQELIDLENQRIIDEEKFQNEFELQSARLETQRLQEVANAEKTGADITVINEKYAIAQEKIDDELQNAKLATVANTFGAIKGLVNKESKAFKALALAEALINTYQGISAGVALGYPAAIPAVIAAATTGFAAVSNIAGVKFEKGGVLDIGGKRHSAGGTKFYGEDGSAFEAEAGEKMFILNRQASAAIAPVLSDINQMYGGVSLSRSSTHLASGGQVLRASSTSVTVPELDYAKLGEFVTEGARQGTLEGSYQGSSQGSSEGTYSGLVDRTENELIESGANF